MDKPTGSRSGLKIVPVALETPVKGTETTNLMTDGALPWPMAASEELVDDNSDSFLAEFSFASRHRRSQQGDMILGFQSQESAKFLSLRRTARPLTHATGSTFGLVVLWPG